MNRANLKRTVLREKRGIEARRVRATRERVGAPVTTDQTVLSLSLSLFIVHSSTCHLGCYIEISTERSDIYSASKMSEQILDVYTTTINVSSITGQDELFVLTIDRDYYYANRLNDTYVF